MKKHQIEIYVFPVESDDRKRQYLYQLLSEDEKRRAARYRFDKHRHRFITGRGTIREILGHRGECPPQDIRFELNKYGKPALLKPDSIRYIQFSASSSDALGAIAISDSMPLGFDIEKIKPPGRNDYDLIVENEFTSDEQGWYASHGNSDRLRAFYELWTCKEAYLKALGIGLSGGLDSFSVALGGQVPRISYTEIEDTGYSTISLCQLDIADDFVACLASPKKGFAIKLINW